MEALSGIGAYAGIGFNLDAWDSGGEQRRREDSSAASSRPARSDTDATGLSLSPEKKEKIRELEQRDREVRAHEQAHQAAASGLALGGATFSLRSGPDGHMYAVGGEVRIDTSRESDPDATIAKARQVRAAANAPAEPSAQDRAVAAEAARMESEARRDKAQETEEQTGRTSIGGPASLSGPPELSGPAASVSGPPQPLNRRTDTLGAGGGDDVDTSFLTAEARHPSAEDQVTADARAEADAAFYRQREADAQSQAEAYARALAQEAQTRVDTASVAPPAAHVAAGADPAVPPLPPEEPLAGADGPDDPAAVLQPIDVTRAADPAAVLAAGSYPLARPPSALFAFNATALNALAAPGRAESAAPVADARALRDVSETEQARTAALQRASSAYRRVGHVPTSLAPYGTGISQTV